jgi:hypothetical protein
MRCDRKPIGRIRASNAIRLLSLMLPIEIKSGTNSRSVKRRAVIALRILPGFAPFLARATDDRRKTARRRPGSDFAEDRKAIRGRRLLADYDGILQVDGHAPTAAV